MAAPDAGASFSIDLAAAQQPIDDLRDAREELRGILEAARAMAFVRPPANDPVSRDAATVLSRAAAGGPGSLYDAVLAGIARLDGLIVDMERELQSYRTTEDANTSTLDRDA